MSKILELLNYTKKREVDKKESRQDFSNYIIPESFDSSTKEKLASTYIFNPTNGSKHIIKKQDDATEHKHPPGQPRPRNAQFFPWLIAFLAILLLLVNIVYRGKVNIYIDFVNKGAGQSPPNALQAISPGEDLNAEAKSIDIAPMSSSLITEGRLNGYIIENLGFYGAALNKSKVLEDGLYLYNDGSTGWASAGIDLTQPMDFSNTTLDFFIKGAKGNESLKLILRDSESNSYIPQAYNDIFNKNMGTDWQFVSIPFKSFNGKYNAEKIDHIGFELGTQTISNESGASMYIKKIKIVKNNRMGQ